MKLYRKISLLAIISSTIAIVCALFLISAAPDANIPSLIYLIINTFSPFNLNIFDPDFQSGTGLLIDLLFDILFLYGGFIYLKEGKKMHMLRFLFSVILISKIIVFLTSFSYSQIDANLLLFLYSRVIDLIWIYLSFRLLKYMNKTRELEVISYEYNSIISTSYVESSNNTRMFHLMIDSVMIVLIFSNPIARLYTADASRESIHSLVAAFGPTAFSFIMLSFVRSIYYIFFEVIFQASPAKFLSETRVLTVDGKPIDFATSLARTFARWIPFNALSFLFARTGWHDRFSGTSVLKEKENSEEKEEITLS